MILYNSNRNIITDKLELERFLKGQVEDAKQRISKYCPPEDLSHAISNLDKVNFMLFDDEIVLIRDNNPENIKLCNFVAFTTTDEIIHTDTEVEYKSILIAIKACPTPDTLFHELLHAASIRTFRTNEFNILKMGLSLTIYNFIEEEKDIGVYLNEGITELLAGTEFPWEGNYRAYNNPVIMAELLMGGSPKNNSVLKAYFGDMNDRADFEKYFDNSVSTGIRFDDMMKISTDYFRCRLFWGGEKEAIAYYKAVIEFNMNETNTSEEIDKKREYFKNVFVKEQQFDSSCREFGPHNETEKLFKFIDNIADEKLQNRFQVQPRSILYQFPAYRL